MAFKESKFWPIQNALNYLDASIQSIQNTCNYGLLKAHEKREDTLEIARQLYHLEKQLRTLFNDLEASLQQQKKKETE